jgi:hypothetical protein
MEAGVRALKKIADWLSVAGLGVASLGAAMALCLSGCGGSSTSIASNQTAAPAFSPGGGNYTSAQTVKITSATSGAVLYCTTDGTTPTTKSPQCSSPTTVLKSEYLQALAVAPNMTASTVSAAGYTINLNATATPAFSPAGGTYNAPQTVTISAATGANIYYCATAGCTPTASSTPYTGPVTVSATETLNAIAIASGYDNSAVASASYTIAAYPAATPTIYPAGGTYPGAVTVTLTDTTPNTTIYYTIDGTTPTTKSPVYSSSNPITVSSTAAIQAIAVASGYTTSAVATAGYVIQTPASVPTFSLAPGTYTTTQTVTLLDATPNATIYYTTNGDTPSIGGATTQSVASGGTVTVAQTETINAIATASGYTSSAQVSAAYTITPAAATPTFDLDPGQTYSTIQTVHILDTTPNATIYCTTNGTPATVKSNVCSAPITLSSSQTINAVAIAPGYSVSADASAVYTVNLTETEQPVLSLGTGIYRPGTTVTISATSGATIHYTLDGKPATVQSPVCTLSNGVCQLTLSNLGTTVLDAVAISSGHTVSPDALAVYTISAAATTPTISVGAVNLTSGGVYPYAGSQSVIIRDTMSNCAKCAIYYTTDGSTPSINSSTTSIYTGTAIPVSSTDETIRAIVAASDGSYSASDVASVELHIYAGAITGKVLSGAGSTATAISGATVELIAAGTTGYSSTPTVAATYPVAATTDSSGNFTLYYNCATAPQDQMYLLATGGSANTNVKLMSALGSSCTTTGGVTTAALPASVTVNEATTIASAYALSAFAKIDSNGGIDIGAPTTGSLCNAPAWQSSGKETCNYNGLRNSFKVANNLVDITTGQTRSHTPDYPTDLAGDSNILNNSNVPQARINALADMLATCVESDGSGCGSGLFSAAKPTGGTEPKDTLQAALNIAQNPGNNVSTLLGLVSSMSTPPYSITSSDPGSTPLALSGTDAPTDLTLALTFTGAGLGISPNVSAKYVLKNGNKLTDMGPTIDKSMAVDSEGNIWVIAYAEQGFNSGSAYTVNHPLLAGFNNLGAPLTTATSLSTATPPVATYGGVAINTNAGYADAIAIDPAETLWITDHRGYLSPFTFDGSNVTAGTAFLNGYELPALAIDGDGHLWATHGATMYEYKNDGTPILQNVSGQDTSYPSTSYSSLYYMTFDSNGELWASDSNNYNYVGSGDVFEINASTGTIAWDAFPSLSGYNQHVTLVADGAGHVYGCGESSGTQLDVYSTAGSLVGAPITINTGRGCGDQLVLDGQGHIFAVNNDPFFAVQGIDEFTTGGVLISPTATGYTGTSKVEPPTLQIDGDTYLAAVTGISAAIDGSGNLWVLNADTNGDNSGNIGGPYVLGNVLVEYVGIGAPVVTPTSAALPNGSLGVRP